MSEAEEVFWRTAARWATTEEVAWATGDVDWYMRQMEGRAPGHLYACGLNYFEPCDCKF